MQLSEESLDDIQREQIVYGPQPHLHTTPVSASHNLPVLSLLAVKIRLPWGLKQTLDILLRDPRGSLDTPPS